jgi:D-inositol-3-phosphate glycosyltransferase
MSDCVVAATPYEFADLLEHYGAKPAQLRVSSPGVDHRLFAPGDRDASRRKLGLGDAPIVLFVGRIQRHKGIDVAVRAVHEVANAHLLIVGGPSGDHGSAELDYLMGLIADLGLSDRVQFIPPQPHDQLADFYRAADTLVMPSRSESFGLVAVEAQACGLPVVAARVGGLASTVADTRSGLLVDGHEPASFAAAITAILDHPDFRETLSAGAVDFARQFSWEAAANRMLELYEGVD